jgi:hypothetical protein
VGLDIQEGKHVISIYKTAAADEIMA